MKCVHHLETQTWKCVQGVGLEGYWEGPEVRAHNDFTLLVAAELSSAAFGRAHKCKYQCLQVRSTYSYHMFLILLFLYRYTKLHGLFS